MKITAFVTLAAAVLAFTDASPIARRPHPTAAGHSVPLTRNPHFKHNTRAQMAKLNKRYPGVNIRTGSSGNVPLTDVSPDLEYYGTVSVGTPAQNVKLDFDTGSSDIWFPSTSCTTTACKKHVRFSSTASSTFQKDGRKWSISYGDGSTASGILGSDMVSVGGIKVRQTIGLATAESTQFGSSPADGLFGLGFDTIESVSGVKTFLDNAIAAGVLAQPVVSVFLPSERRFNGIEGASNDPNNGWVVPCSVAQDTENYVSFSMGGADFKVPLADLAYEDLGDGNLLFNDHESGMMNGS
ncbi:acid protease [Linnemannia elongata AG-77]|uniref:Acid protease n=1 Tax=Linnemannia elongata AG-77 TaxID=1314771 RepID=A0A197KAB6_9FUNG|nr:acid protease [Linnemannia elongata AG-77]